MQTTIGGRMTEHASATFKVEGWNVEKTVEGGPGAISLA
jgi:hypothetical protein